MNGHKNASARAMMVLAGFAAFIAFLYVIDNDRFYLWMVAMHVLAIISWMAGLLYLPRLFINHMDVAAGSEASEHFKGMEKRLLKIIMNPAMMMSWVLGLFLAHSGGHFAQGWFLMKFLAVLLLSACHMYLAKAVRLFEADANLKSQNHWRIVNEMPAVLMVIIVVMVIVKPF